MTPEEKLQCLVAQGLQIMVLRGRCARCIRPTTITPCVAESGSNAVACLNPLGGWYASTPNDSGRHSVTFSLHSGYQDRPIDIPCGKCIGCLRDKATGWAIRCYHESIQHLRNSFVTLTYDEQHCPSAVSKRELQLLFKRMRKGGMKFRYFGAGELGSRTRRPHYHVLFFGEDFLSDAVPFGANGEYYTSEKLSSYWGLGMAMCAPCEPASCFYTASYALKNLDDPDAFHISSRKPYLGHGWLSRYYDDISRNGFITIEGRKVAVPKSYLLRPEFALEFDQLKEKRKAYVNEMTPDQIVKRREAARGKETNMRAMVRNARSTI